MAEKAGMSLRTFNRELSELRKAGAIKIRRYCYKPGQIILTADKVNAKKSPKFVMVNEEWLRVLSLEELGLFAYLLWRTYPAGKLYGEAILKVSDKDLALELNCSLRTIERLKAGLKRKEAIEVKKRGWGAIGEIKIRRKMPNLAVQEKEHKAENAKFGGIGMSNLAELIRRYPIINTFLYYFSPSSIEVLSPS